MTVAVLATTTTKTQRREPLGRISMAAPKTQSRTGASSGSGKTVGRRTTRLSTSQHEPEEIPSKRKSDYEQDEDGFQFSRVPSKKSKPSIEAVPENTNSDVENAHKPTPKRGRPKKKPADSATASAIPAKGTAMELSGRRPTREKDTYGEAGPRTEIARPQHHDDPNGQPERKNPKKGRPPKSKAPEGNGYNSPEQPPAGTKVALHTADTPVIQRNKELRGGKGDKGKRRSSLSMRGRRASSLIDSGASNALPHREVGTADFFKHIADDGLPEPRRMRQLLIWCATRALGNKSTGNPDPDEQSAYLAARQIQEEILREFSNNPALTNWFSREDVNPPAVVVKKPNPRNVQNMDKIKELEEHIQRLQKERQSLNALLRQPAIPSVTTDPRSDQRTALSSRKSHRQEVDPSLLDPSQKAILNSLNPSTPPSEGDTSKPTQPPFTPSAVSAQISRITASLAPTLDAFAAGVHDIELYRASADTVSSRVLRICAQRLEERDAQNTQRRHAIEGTGGESPPRIKEDLGIILGALSRVERR